MKNKALFIVLAGSIAQLVRGAVIETNSPVTGNWSDPASWSGNVVPDTYGFDSAVIHAGDVIDFDSGVSTPGGGLSVAAGNFITIDGGTLTQSTATDVIRIGEGSAGAGDGTLTINSAGSFNSGAAVAVAIGASLGGGPGSGIVDLNDGTFTMGAGAAAGGLVVGLDGSTGVFNLGDGTGVAGTAVLDLATNNIGLGIGFQFAGPTGGTGTVAIKSDGLLNLGTADIAVGTGGGTATLSISGGSLIGLAAGGGSIIVGGGDGSTGSLVIDTDGTLANSGQLRIGSNGGVGTFTMTSGTLAINNEFSIGAGVGALVSNGQASISGGTVTVGQTLIGRDGATGILSLSGTASMTTNGNFYIGTAGSVGTVSMTGGTLASTGVIEVGASGAGTMTITAGTVSSGGETRVGQGIAGTGTLNFSGTANWTSGGEIQVGNDGGSGTVNMSGGEMIANTWFGIGRTGGTGIFNLSGGTITKGTSANTGSFDIGSYNGGNAANPVSTGTLEQTGGVIVDTVADFNVGRDANTVGTWNMSGGSANFASGDPATTGQNVRVGNSGTGTANFTGGVVTGIKNLEAGSNAGAIGVINVDYPLGTDTLPFDQMYLGFGAGASGTVNVFKGTLALHAWSEIGRNGGTGVVNIVGADSHFTGSGSDMQIGYGNGAMGSVNITNGGSFAHNWWINLGRNGDATGNILVDGAGSTLTQTNGRLNLGGDPNNGTDSGKGFIVISNGGHIEHAGDEMNYGTNVGSVGSMTINSGGTFNSTGGQTEIGRNGGTGTLNVLDAGSSFTVNDETFVGRFGGATGTINLKAGGAITINQWLNVGRENGTGTVNQEDGTFSVQQDARFGFAAGGSGTLNLTGGTFTANRMAIGAAGGTGLANASNGSVSSINETIVGGDPGSVGTLNLSDTATWTSGNEFQVGNNGGVGVANILGGTYIAKSYVAIGRNTDQNGGANGGNGTINMSAGTLMKVADNGGSFDVGSWNGGNAATTNTSGTLNQTGGDVVITGSDAHVGRDAGVVGLWKLSGGSVTQTGGNFNVGQGGIGTFTITGGTVTDNINEFRVANNPTAVGLMTVGGTDAFNLTAGANSAVGQNFGTGTLNLNNPNANLTFNAEFWVGNGNGNGTMNMSAGAIIANSWFDLGRDSGTGVVNLTGGSITKLTGTGQMNIGSSGTGHGTLNQSGGIITNTAVATLVARDPLTVGLWDITGGTATLADLLIGASGNGTVNIHGTDTVTITTNGLRVGGENGNTGVGTLIISNPNATITTNNEVGIGRNGGHGEVHQSAGIVNAGGGWFGIANDGGSGVSGLYDISGGELHVLSPTTSIELGADGAGELRASGTAVVTAGNIHVSQRITGTGTLNVSDSASVTTAGQIVVGFGSSNANVANLTGGTVSTGSETVVGQGFNIPDPTNNPTVSVANVGTLNITGPGTWTSGGEFQVGNNGGVGVANISAGHLIAKTYVAIGRNTPDNDASGVAGGNGGNGTINLSGTGIIEKIDAGAGGTFDIGSWNGTHPETTNTFGTLNQDGGAIINTVSDTHIGRDTGVVGVWNISAGTANLARLNVGNDGTGTLNMTGGSISAADHVAIASGGTSTGTANLTGGVLATRFVEAGAGVAALNLNGGTLQALADEGDFLRNINPTNSEVVAGGVIFDTNGFNIAVNNQFDGVGGLVKNGEGNLTVTNAANANTGGTIVNRGNVIYPVISAAGPGTVDILINAPGAAALDGTDLTPLQARTITTSNGAIALHDNTATVPLDFSSYPNLSLGSVGTSNYDLALTPGGGNYRLGGGGGTLTVSTVLTGANGLVVNGNGLKGTVILTSQETYTGPTNVASGIAILASGVNTLPATALTIGATATVGLNGNNQAVGSLAGAAGAVLNNSGAAAVFTTGVDNTSTIYDGLITGNISVVKIGTGTQTISAAQTYSALSVNAGAVVLGGTNHLGALSLADGTTATLTSHAGGLANVKVIETSALTLAGNAKLDLTNNAMVVRGGDYATLLAKTVSGFNGSLWNGVGINSSAAAAEPDGRTAIAIANNADLGFSEFAGITGLTGNEILFKYTYYGDANLDGNVGAEDFSAFLQGFTGAEPASWLTGDFNYDGAVGAEDFSAFLANFSTVLPQLRDEALTEQMNSFALQLSTGGSGAIGDSGSSLDGGSPTAGQAVVPEPGSIGLLAAGALGLIARRRRGTPRS